MADVSTYKRANSTYATSVMAIVIHAGEIRVGTDPIVLANPGFWTTVTDAEMTTGKKHLSDSLA